ncbi:hypothetical protein GCM10007972_27780 [Iodidimonas muriae]|uniref:Uncharacterized protein n=1 Tax=Iodidimonas muriae TaxID=261467 RepID=A0ABQ2LJB4_9PROT|nr:hypothetical protein [Iodidimonas muriae]GER08827.1 hypothetical protein JCM17843_31370 [Kordiimonadales bacterium JCM 17843]GGO17583.1 hypothetical protein GCM10007972_27780 [Iodidimonas muriae]
MHTTKKQVLIKFILLLCILLGYFAYLSWKFDVGTGGLVVLLTWSFFVLCTPIADAGFLLDFPLRLLFGIRMFVSEIVVWGIAISISAVGLLFARDAFQKTMITSLLEKILTTPYPYWGIIVLSGVGTFLSIRFGDELMDVVEHRDRILHHKHGFTHTVIVYGGILLLIIVGYHHLLASLGITGVVL